MELFCIRLGFLYMQKGLVMSATSQNEGKKWIQTSTALVCMILGYVVISFFDTLGEWFELETKISSFNAISQVLGVVIALSVFVYIMKNEKTSTFLNEVYTETIKVVFPDKSQTVSHTIGIMIGVTIVGVMLWVFDRVAIYLLGLLN